MGSSQTEVQNFQGTVTPDDDVRRLQVLKGRHGIRSAEVAYPVDDAGLVEMSDAAEHLVEEVGEALVVEVHLDHLKRPSFGSGACPAWQRLASISSMTM